LFSEQYVLTAAELRLCRALADGFSIAEYSKKYRLTLNTARSQLKSIFAKTAARRQTDLLLLIFAILRS
jgi:DNA-binding CsgD family transcriptional regulator